MVQFENIPAVTNLHLKPDPGRISIVKTNYLIILSFHFQIFKLSHFQIESELTNIQQALPQDKQTAQNFAVPSERSIFAFF